MSKYGAVYFVDDNQAINRVRVGSFKTRNRGAFSGLLAALINMLFSYFWVSYNIVKLQTHSSLHSFEVITIE